MSDFTVSFPETTHDSVVLSCESNLSEELTAINSPVLFGCRSGICGTCLVEIQQGYKALPPPDAAEQEALEIYAPGNAKARLACQVRLTADISLKKIKSQ